MWQQSIAFMGLVSFLFAFVASSRVQFVIEAPQNDENNSLVSESLVPVVINTWGFSNATKKAWEVLQSSTGNALDAVEQGCTVCEDEQCDGTVGFGGSPDENGETTLDAMIMDGPSHCSGAVANLKRIKHAISVARQVMERTQHTLLVGEAATKFALEMGFTEENLTTEKSSEMWQKWLKMDCQPNFWKSVEPDSRWHCGPYKPSALKKSSMSLSNNLETKSHDTIGMVVIDSNGNMASGTSTNGANHKIPGRVGDAPITGSGSYVDQQVGGAAATGDGDVLMRFLPSLVTVENMRHGMTASTAAAYSLKRIADYYPNYCGAVVALKNNGEFGAACHGFKMFEYSVANVDLGSPQVFRINCVNPQSNC